MSKLKLIAGLLGLCGVVLSLIFTAQRTKTQSEYMAFLHSLQTTNITKIEIYEQMNSETGSLVSSVSSPGVLDAFARAANTVESWSPNHPVSAKSYHVELYLSDGQKQEFRFDVMAGTPDHTIYIYFSGGRGKSTALFDWLKTQMPNT